MIIICPFCENVSNDQVPYPDDGATEPRNGDASICGQCGEVAVFDNAAPTGLRVPIDEEQRNFATNPDVILTRAMVETRKLG